jgi:transposase InsO family protein
MWDRVLWVLGRRFCADWRRHLVLITPDTVVRWHRQGWRLYWRWRSPSCGGRPRLSVETRELIRSMSRDSPLWGTERIRGELLQTRDRRQQPLDPALPLAWPRSPAESVVADLPRQPPAQQLGGGPAHRADPDVRRLYILIFVAHGRRELVHLAVTAHPTAAWVWRQLINATPWGRAPAYLVRDRDAVYGAAFARTAGGLGIRTVLTPVRSPRANAVAERLVGTLRRECLDHLIAVNERHLRAILSDFAEYYIRGRPHQTLGMDTPRPVARPPVGSIRSRPVLGGLHCVYERAA